MRGWHIHPFVVFLFTLVVVFLIGVSGGVVHGARKGEEMDAKAISRAMTTQELLDSDEARKIKSGIPADWKMEADAEKLVIRSAEVYRIYNASNMPYLMTDREMERYVREHGRETQYELYLMFEHRWTDAKIRKVKSENDKVHRAISLLHEQHKQYWKPRDEEFNRELERLGRKIQKIPDFNTKKYSIVMSDNVHEPYRLWHKESDIMERPYRTKERLKEIFTQMSN